MLKIFKNPNIEEYEEISRYVVVNNGYCPCKLVKSDDTKCPCKEFRDQKAEGYCHCGRYRKEEVISSGETDSLSS